ncbi:MAG: flippase, partial [Methanomethylovorans sp.]|nr:flippase [Methanomethylovorans sp.]
MSDRKELMQKLGLIGFANLVFSLNSIVLLPVLTKNLTVHEYGIWAQIIVTIGFAPLLFMFGLQYSMARFVQSIGGKSEVQDLFYSIFFFVATIGLFASAIVYIFAEKISILLFDGETIIVQILSAIIVIESVNAVLLHFFRSLQQTKRYTVFLLAQALIQIFLISVLVLLGKGIYGAVIAVLLKGIILFAIMLFFIVKTIGFKLPKFKYLREHIAFGLPTMPSELSTWIVSSSDRYLISFLLGATYVGYYAPAYTLGNNIMLGLITPISLVLPPFLAKLYDSKKNEAVKSVLEKSLRYFLFIGIPATFGLFFLSKPLLKLLTTEEIAAEGYLILSIAAISTLLFGISTILNQIAILNKKTQVIGKIWLVSAILKVGLNLLLIPYVGIVGAALVTLIIFILSLVFSATYCLKLIQLEFNYIFIGKSIIASLAMIILLFNLEPCGVLQIFTLI